jgi:hypothetical protein
MDWGFPLPSYDMVCGFEMRVVRFVVIQKVVFIAAAITLAPRFPYPQDVALFMFCVNTAVACEWCYFAAAH